MPYKNLIQFPSGNFVLTATWDWPDAQGDQPAPGVIFCHGFTGNRFESRRLYVRTAEKLSSMGIACFRFDHRGCGESSGDFRDFTPTGMFEDLQAALGVFLGNPRLDPNRLAVVGYSLGGASATYLTKLHPSFKTAAVWAAVAQPEIIRDRLASYPDFPHYKTRGYFDYMGFRVSQEYVDGVGERLRPLDWIADFPAPILAIQGLTDPIVKPEQMDLYQSVRSNPNDRFVTISNADHSFGPAVTADLVIQETCAWLQRYLLG